MLQRIVCIKGYEFITKLETDCEFNSHFVCRVIQKIRQRQHRHATRMKKDSLDKQEKRDLTTSVSFMLHFKNDNQRVDEHRGHWKRQHKRVSSVRALYTYYMLSIRSEKIHSYAPAATIKSLFKEMKDFRKLYDPYELVYMGSCLHLIENMNFKWLI